MLVFDNLIMGFDMGASTDVEKDMSSGDGVNHLVVGCVGTKSLKGPELKDFEGPINDKFEKWFNALRKQRAKRKAMNLYGGGMWSAYMDAYDAMSSGSELWVVSAGLGFINGKDEIPGYNVTFKGGKENSVSTSVRKKREWWNMLTDENITSGCSSISELINSLGEDDFLTMVLGRDYYEAVYDDLERVNSGKDKPKADIALVGIKEEFGKYTPRVPKQLEEYVVPYRDYGKLREELDCSMIQVHPRTAERLITNYMKEGDLELDIDGLGDVYGT